MWFGSRGLRRMIAAGDAVERVERWAGLHARGVLCDTEMANAFLGVVLEAEFAAAAPCLAVFPASARPALGGMLTALAGRDWYDDRHRYISDGRTHEQRQAHYRSMQPHYRLVGEWLLGQLADRGHADPGSSAEGSGDGCPHGG